MEHLLYTIKNSLPKSVLKNVRPVYHFSLAWLAAFWYRHPSEKLIVIGVTGTTSKTTTIHLIAKALEQAGYRVGYTSTAMFKVAEREWNNDKKMTMLGRFFTQRMLRDMARAGCHYAIIETTSQGIEQFRHRFINYDIGVFTGLYSEHTEAHGGFENYQRAKGKLFAHISRFGYKYVDGNRAVIKITNELKKIHLEKVKKIIIANGDDERADYFLQFKAEEKIKYEVRSKKSETEAEDKNKNIKEIIANGVEAKSEGVQFFVEGVKFNLQLMGEFNVYNALAAVSIGRSQGLTLETIKSGLEKISGVPGRFERIDEGQDFTVIVDYAFEPNAVQKLYETAARIAHARIIHVLGSTGGGRDISRRPVLGRLAGSNADIVIVTNEDPYDDAPEIIIDQVSLGAEKEGKELDKNLFKITDRRFAIKKALALALSGDIVFITGKGNEQAMCVAGGKKIPWDDRAVAREELQKLQLK